VRPDAFTHGSSAQRALVHPGLQDRQRAGCDTFNAQAPVLRRFRVDWARGAPLALCFCRSATIEVNDKQIFLCAGRAAQRAVADMGYESMTPIQAQAIPWC
jgi:hypothetical protein